MIRLVSVSCVWLLALLGPAAAEMCLLAPDEGASAEGKLVVNEGAFILEIEEPICLLGEEESDGVGPTQRIHLTTEDDAIEQRLVQLKGKRIGVSGSMFAMHTQDHKAPIVMMTKAVIAK